MKTIIENEDNTIVVDSKIYDQAKDTDVATTNKEAILLSLTKGLHNKQDRKNYPDSIFWFKDGIYMFEYDEKEKYFWCSYVKVWSVFENEFNMQYDEIQLFVRELLERQFKRRGLKANYASTKFTNRVEQHFRNI